MSESDSLPLELWVEIFSYLPYADVLRFRQACKWMSRISSARPVWVSQYRRLCASVSDPPGLGQASIYMTADDLEKATLRRIKWEALWRSSTCSPTLAKDVNVPLKTRRSVLTVDGRWLLYIQMNPEDLGDSIILHDMHNPLASPGTLVDPFLHLDNIHDLISIAVDVDASQPCLVFNVCVTVTLKDEGTQLSYGLVFYRITQSGLRLDARLTSKYTKSLVLNTQGVYRKPGRVLLSGRYYLRVFENEGTRLEIYDWHASDSQTHVMTFVGTGNLTPTFYGLLPNHQLLACWDKIIRLFPLTGFQTVKNGETLPLANEMIPSWTDVLPPGRCLHISIPAFYHPSASVRFAYSMSTGIYGVSVPSLECGPPLHIKLSDTVLPAGAALTTQKFIYLQSLDRLIKGRHVWPDDAPWGDDEQVVETRFLPLSHGYSRVRFYEFDDLSCSMIVEKDSNVLSILHV